MRNIHRFCIAVLVCLTLFASAQEDRDSRIKSLRVRLAPALALSFEDLQLALSIKVHEISMELPSLLTIGSTRSLEK